MNSPIVASATSRCMAFAIDLVFGAALIWVAMYATLQTTTPREFLLKTGYSELGFVLVVPTAMFAAFLAHGNATPGMIAADIQVLEKKRRMAIGWRVATLRTLLWPLSLAPLGLGMMLHFVTKERQTLHDLLSGSIVVERPFIGTKLSYQAWPAFWGMTVRSGPIIMAVILGAMVYMNSTDKVREFIVDAAVAAACLTILMTASYSILKVHTSKAKLTPSGIQRSGLLGWKKRVVEWGDIDHAIFKDRPYFSYLRCKTKNRSSFRLPVDSSNSHQVAQELGAHGVRIE